VFPSSAVNKGDTIKESERGSLCNTRSASEECV
jgi:hypothetical protein